jgi:hypothetical protein
LIELNYTHYRHAAHGIPILEPFFSIPGFGFETVLILARSRGITSRSYTTTTYMIVIDHNLHTVTLQIRTWCGTYMVLAAPVDAKQVEKIHLHSVDCTAVLMLYEFSAVLSDFT